LDLFNQLFTLSITPRIHSEVKLAFA